MKKKVFIIGILVLSSALFISEAPDVFELLDEPEELEESVLLQAASINDKTKIPIIKTFFFIFFSFLKLLL